MRVLVIGGGRVGTEIVERLEERGENVVIIEQREQAADDLRNQGFAVRDGNGTNIETLREAGAERSKIVVAATGDDDTNLLVAQLASSKFDTETVISRVNEPDNVDAFNELGVKTVSASSSTAWAIDNLIERPALSRWMTEIGRSGDVQEIEVTDETLVSKTVGEVSEMLPGGCMIALLSRDQENIVPETSREIQYGDHLTVLGQTDSVHEAIDRLHPHD